MSKIEITMLTRYAGPAGNFPAGSVISVSLEEGETLIKAGFATPVRTQKVETAVDTREDVEVAAESKDDVSDTNGVENEKPKPKFKPKSKSK